MVNDPRTEHEHSRLDEGCEKQAWCGKIGSEFYDDIGGGGNIGGDSYGPANVKALIDDSTSGGLEVVPVELDSDIITFPLLHGELFPMVDLKAVPRGRRIEGASIGTPTMSWGGGDDQSISLFNTAS